jgi:hypothetical protein
MDPRLRQILRIQLLEMSPVREHLRGKSQPLAIGAEYRRSRVKRRSGSGTS